MKKKHFFKSALAMLMALVMCITMTPSVAYEGSGEAAINQQAMLEDGNTGSTEEQPIVGKATTENQSTTEEATVQSTELAEGTTEVVYNDGVTEEIDNDGQTTELTSLVIETPETTEDIYGISTQESGNVGLEDMTLTVGANSYTSGQTALISDSNTFTLTFKIAGNASWVNRKIILDIPVGFSLVSGPGVQSVAGAKYTAQAFTPEQALVFSTSTTANPNPVWTSDGTKTLAPGGFSLVTKSGTLIYNVKDGVSGYVVTYTLQAEGSLYNCSGAHDLKDLTVTMTGDDAEGILPQSTFTDNIHAQLGTATMDTKAYINTNQYANSAAIDGAKAYLGQIQNVRIGLREAYTFAAQNKVGYNTTFDYVYPKGAIISLQTTGWTMVGEAVDNTDGTMTQKFTSTSTRNVWNSDARVDGNGRTACMISLIYPKDSVFDEGDVLHTIVKNCTFQTAQVNADESVTYLTHTCLNEPQTTTTIIHENDFNPPYTVQQVNTQKKNGYDGVQQQLFYCQMTLSGIGGASGGSEKPVRFCYEGDPLDNVEYLSIPVSNPTDLTNLTAIHIEFSDGSSIDWTGTGTMPGGIRYNSSGELGTAWRYTADTGKYISRAYVEYSKVTETEAASTTYGRCYAKGRPVTETYTGTFSHHTFYTQQSDGLGGWITVSTSDIAGEDADNYQGVKEHGGFRWEKPADFALEAVCTSTNCVNSYDGIGRAGQEGAIRPGVTTLSSFKFTNSTGSSAETDVRVDFLLNQNDNKDLISQIQFPYSYIENTTEAAAQVKSIQWTYTDGTTGSWNKDSGEACPFTADTSHGTIDAPEGKYFASFSVELSNWNASTQVATALIGGRPETERYGDLSQHTITITSVGDEEKEICSTQAGFTYREPAAMLVNPLGTNEVVTAGSTGSLKIRLQAGYRSANGTAGIAEENTKWYGHSTFAFILPECMIPTSNNLKVTWPGNRMGYDDTKAKLISSHTASAAELAAANLTGLNATVYIYEFENQDATWIDRYPYRNLTIPEVTLPFTVDVLSDTYLFTYGQLFYASSNLSYELTGDNGSTTATTYVNGDKNVSSTVTRNETSVISDLGKTQNIVRGDSATIQINKDPALVIQEHIMSTSEGDYRVYDGEDEDTVAHFAKNETGLINLKIYNTVSDDTIVVKDGYVFVPIPKKSDNSNQVNQSEFDFTLNGTPSIVTGHENVEEVDVRYITDSTSITVTTAFDVYNNASSTYNSNAKMVAFKLDDLKSGKALEISIPIKAPAVASDDMLYDEFGARSVFLFNPTSWATFDSGTRTGFLRAGYINPDYTLTFDSQGGSEVPSNTVETGNHWTKPADPTYSGYSFGGWFTDSACENGNEFDFSNLPNEDETVYAKWIANTYNVVYNTQGGIPESINSLNDIDWDSDNLIPAANPTKAGYTFTGWNTKADGSGTSVNMTSKYSEFAESDEDGSSTTLYAQWNELADITINYTSSDTAMGNVSPKTETIAPVSENAAGSVAVANTGYEFVKWVKGTDTSLTAISEVPGFTPARNTDGLNEAATYTAVFAPKTNTQYVVSYWKQNIADDNYTIVSADTKNKTGTTDAEPEIDTITYTGFTKDHITYEKTGTAASTGVLNIAPDGSLVINVYYNRNTHSVSYDVNNHGIKPASETNIKYGDLVTEPTALTATGYTFGGWYTDKACTSGNEWNFGTDTMPDSDKTLYAKWTTNKYTVSFKNDGANADNAAISGDSDQVIAYTQKAAELCTILITDTDNYELIGWSYDYVAADGSTQKGVALGATGYTSIQVLGNVTFHAVIFKMPFVSAVAENGKVSIAETVDAASTPSSENASMEGISADQLPVSAGVRFAPENENYQLESITVKDFAGSTPLVLTGETLKSGTFNWTTKAMNGTDDEVAAITVDLTNNTISTNEKLYTSVEFDVVYTSIKTTYKVEHYLMTINGEYPLEATDSEELPDESTIAAGSDVIYTVKNYTGAVNNPALTTYQDSVVTTPQSAVTKVKYDGSTVVKLYYERSQYNLTFNANGHGTAPAQENNIYYGASTTEPSAPTAAGYTFGGWYKDAECTTTEVWNFDTDTMPDENVTLYAKWTENSEITINYVSDNTDMGTVSKASESVRPATGNPQGSTAIANTGYHFVKWMRTLPESAKIDSIEGESLVPVKNGGIYIESTYKAVFAANTNTKYTVYYYQQNVDEAGYTEVTDNRTNKTGTTLAVVDQTIGTVAYEGFTQNRITYKNSDQTDEQTESLASIVIAPDNSLVVRIYYNRNKHNVTFNENGHGIAPAAKEDVIFGTTISEPEKPEALGYTLEGWYTDAACTDGNKWDFQTDIMPDEDVILYAKWTENSNVNISYVSSNEVEGTVTNALDTVAPATGTATGSEAIANEGYHFENWTSGESTFDNAVLTKEDVDSIAKVSGIYEATEFIANFAANTYTVTFDGNGAVDGNMENAAFTYDEKQNLAENVFTKPGYYFAGWATSADGQVVYQDEQEIENLIAENGGNITLYAVWSLAKPVVLDLPVSKKIDGDKPDSNAVFTFEFTAKSTTAEGLTKLPMPSGATTQETTGTVKGEGSVEFGDITFTMPGTYVYEVKEVNDNQEGYTYDSSVYTITYEIIQNGDALEGTITVVDAAENKADVAEFINTYKAKVTTEDTTNSTSNPTVVTTENNNSVSSDSAAKTGDTSNAAAVMMIMLLAGGILVLLMDKKRKQK